MANLDTDWTMPVGADQHIEHAEPVRYPAQHKTAREIVARDDFLFALNNPFTAKIARRYKGPVNFLWCETNGTLHIAVIGVGGRILREAVLARPASHLTRERPALWEEATA